MKALEVSVSSRFATILKSKSHSIHSFLTKTSISLNSLFTRMSPMIVFKVIAVFVAMAVMSSPVLSQAVDCTDADQPMSKEIFDQTCKPTFCDCLSINKTCPPEWSRSWADGLAVYRKFDIYKQAPFLQTTCKQTNGSKHRIIYYGTTTDTPLVVTYYIPAERLYLYFYQNLTIEFKGEIPEKYVGEVRYPDTSEGWLSTPPFGPKLKAKLLWDLTIQTVNAEIVNWSKETKHYPSRYSFTVPTDPLFDRRITEELFNTVYLHFQLDKYYNWNDSIHLQFQAITLENNFDLKFDSKIKLIRLKKYFYFCLDEKIDAQTGRKYWTPEGCRPVIQLKVYQLKKLGQKLDINVGGQYEIKCVCDSGSIPVTPTVAKEPKTDAISTEEQSDQSTEHSDSSSDKPTARRVRSAPTNEPKLVDGFNLPEGLRKPRKLIKPSYALYVGVVFTSIALAICLIEIVVMIVITVKWMFFKRSE